MGQNGGWLPPRDRVAQSAVVSKWEHCGTGNPSVPGRFRADLLTAARAEQISCSGSGSTNRRYSPAPPYPGACGLDQVSDRARLDVPAVVSRRVLAGLDQGLSEGEVQVQAGPTTCRRRLLGAAVARQGRRNPYRLGHHSAVAVEREPSSLQAAAADRWGQAVTRGVCHDGGPAAVAIGLPSTDAVPHPYGCRSQPRTVNAGV